MPSETITYNNRQIHLEWHESDTYPDGIKVSQVTGFCLDEKGRILLVRDRDRHSWGFPGGHPEAGEAPLETLRREVLEEANAEIEPLGLVGYVDVSDPENEGVEGKRYIQLRFLARVIGLNEWVGEFETAERVFVSIEDISKYVPWVTSPVGSGQVDSLCLMLSRIDTK